MADNITLNSGSGGKNVATDDVGGVQYQRVKLDYGSNGATAPVTEATPLPVMDAILEIVRDKRTGFTTERKFGASQSVGTTARDITALATGAYPFPQSALQVRVKAGGDANDTAVGTGTRSVRIDGLDTNLDFVSQLVNTAGASASLYAATALRRIVRAYSFDAGTYGGSNASDIIIENSAGDELAQIDAGLGQTQLGVYTVPAGKTAYVFNRRAQVSGNKAAELRFWQRQGADDVAVPFVSKRLVTRFPSFTGIATDEGVGRPAFVVIPEKTDLWWSGFTASGTTEVSVWWDMILVDD